MNSNLEGKVFVVAGGNKGIGYELVRQLSVAGADVIVFSRTAPQSELPERVTTYTHDFLNDVGDWEMLPKAIDGVAYCPGTINVRSFRSLKPDDFRSDLETNLIGAIKFLKACWAGLKQPGQQPASAVLFSTVAVGKGLAMHSSIAAAKGAIEGLTRSLASEWAPRIRVNCVAPALTETSLSENFFSTEEKKSAMAARYPMQRTGEPRDIAATARFLLDPANSWITGQVIGVDGGMSTLA